MGCCCQKSNLKTETLQVLSDYGLNQSDVIWVGGKDFTIPVEKFWELAEAANYHSGFGRQMIASDLIIVCNGCYLVRQSYEGSEWWKIRPIPVRPEYQYDICRIMCEEDDENLEGQTLKELNIEQNDNQSEEENGND